MSNKKIIEKATGIQWKEAMRRKSPVLWRYFESLGARKEYFRKSKSEIDIEIDIEHKVVDQTVFFSKTSYEYLLNLLGSKVKAKKLDYFLDVVERSKKQSREFLNFCREIKENENNETKSKNLKNFLNVYAEKTAKLGTFRITLYFLKNLLEKRIVDYFPKGQNIQIVEPEKRVPFQEKRQKLLKIAEKVQSNEKLREIFDGKPADIKERLKEGKKEVYKNVLEIAEEYGWLGMYRYMGEQLSEEDIISEIKYFLDTDPEEKISELERNENIPSLDTKSKEAENILRIAKKYLYFWEYFIDVFSMGNYYVKHILENIAKKIGIEYSDLIYLTIPEIVASLNGEKTSPAEIQNRKENYAMLFIDGEFTILTGNDVENLREKKKRKKREETEGRIAHPGVAVGEAKLVFDLEDLEDVSKGDIVLSPMTKKEMTPVLEKASGIVTDEGGILCHAAIISRELGIPCVTGTGDSTEIFEEGQLIKIEAREEGIVKLLEIQKIYSSSI